MVGTLLNLRKLTTTSPSAPPTPEHLTRPVRAGSRLSRLGSAVGAPLKGSPETLDGSSATLTDRSIGSGRPWKQFRRQSKSFSSAFASLFPLSPPATPTHASSGASPAFISGTRPRFASERRKKQRHQDDGLKHRISYPLLLRESLENQTGRETWGARDETQKAPTPTTTIASSVSRCSSKREIRPRLQELGTCASPPASAATPSLLCPSRECSGTPAAAPESTQTRSTMSPLYPCPLDITPVRGWMPSSLRRSSVSTAGSVDSTVTESSFAWVDFPSTMTMTIPIPSTERPTTLVARTTADAEGAPGEPAVSSLGLNSDPDPFRRSYDANDVFTARSGSAMRPFPPSTITRASRNPDGPAPGVAKRMLFWTSKDVAASDTLPAIPRALPPFRGEHLWTPQSTPRIRPTCSNQAKNDSKPAWSYETKFTQNGEAEPDSATTRVSLLSLTLAELSDEMAALSRTRATESSRSSDDGYQTSTSPSSRYALGFAGGKSSLDQSRKQRNTECTSSRDSEYGYLESPTPLPPKFRARHYHHAQLPSSPNRHLQPHRRLLRRISQRLCPARLSPPPRPARESSLGPARAQQAQQLEMPRTTSPGLLPPPELESLTRRSSFAHRVTRTSAQFFAI